MNRFIVPILGSQYSYLPFFQLSSKVNNSSLLASAKRDLTSVRFRTIRIRISTVSILRAAISKARPIARHAARAGTTTSIQAHRQSASSKERLATGCWRAVSRSRTAVSALGAAVAKCGSLTSDAVSAGSIRTRR